MLQLPSIFDLDNEISPQHTVLLPAADIGHEIFLCDKIDHLAAENAALRQRSEELERHNATVRENYTTLSAQYETLVGCLQDSEHRRTELELDMFERGWIGSQKRQFNPDEYPMLAAHARRKLVQGWQKNLKLRRQIKRSRRGKRFAERAAKHGLVPRQLELEFDYEGCPKFDEAFYPSQKRRCLCEE